MTMAKPAGLRRSYFGGRGPADGRYGDDWYGMGDVRADRRYGLAEAVSRSGLLERLTHRATEDSAALPAVSGAVGPDEPAVPASAACSPVVRTIIGV